MHLMYSHNMGWYQNLSIIWTPSSKFKWILIYFSCKSNRALGRACFGLILMVVIIFVKSNLILYIKGRGGKETLLTESISKIRKYLPRHGIWKCCRLMHKVLTDSFVTDMRIGPRGSSISNGIEMFGVFFFGDSSSLLAVLASILNSNLWYNLDTTKY